MPSTRTRVLAVAGPLIVYLLLSLVLTACAAIGTAGPGASAMTPGATLAESASAFACLVTEPLRAIPPEDSAVQGTPDYGYYFVNEDRSIWASAWGTRDAENYWRASEEGVKAGWFRPAGVDLEITGRRLDAQTPALEADVPCCYPTRFQATGLTFPAEGCWEVTAKAGDSLLSFIVKVEP